MLPVYICEDNEQQLSLYKSAIEKYISENEADEFELSCITTNPMQLLDHLKNHIRQSIYFLDINLGLEFINGIELGAEIRKFDPLGYIILITTHTEMAPLTFQYMIEAMDYISKDEDNVEMRIRRCLDNIIVLQHNSHKAGPAHLTIGTQIIPLSDIYSISIKSGKSHNIEIYSSNSLLYFRGALKDILAKLDSTFFRCHKSCIVNLNHVTGMDRHNRCLSLDNGTTVPYAYRLSREIRQRLNVINQYR